MLRKGKTAVTDPARIRKDDPGHPKVCTVFAYQKEFNKSFAPELEKICKKGEIGCVECKKRLAAALNAMLEPIREKRNYYESHLEEVDAILHAGTQRAISVGAQTLAEVKEAMKIDYFG